MKKLFIILIIFLTSGTCFAQFARPAGIVAVPSYTLWRNPADSAITIYQGSVNLYNTFVQDFDTVKLSGWVNNRKLLKYRLIGDSILKDGTASNYKLLHKIDSIMALVKYRNDTVVITGYATRGYVQRNFVVKNDSSKLYELKSNKVTSISDGTTDIQYPSAKLLYDKLGTKIDTSSRAQPLGVATLGSDGKVPSSQIGAAFLGAVNYVGTWSAVYNIPTLPAAAVGNKGDYYVATDSATYLGTIYRNKDWIISNGSTWQKVDNSTSFSVSSIVDTYEYEVMADGLTNKTLPFIIRDKTQVWYNGSILRKSNWAGTYTVTLNLLTEANLYDYVTVYSTGLGISPYIFLWRLDGYGNLTTISEGSVDSWWELDVYGNITPLASGTDNTNWKQDIYGNLTPN